MKRLLLSMLIVSALSISAQYEQIHEQKEKGNTDISNFKNPRSELFNFDWRFHIISDTDSLPFYTSADFDDSGWRTVDLPTTSSLNSHGTKKGAGHAYSNHPVKVSTESHSLQTKIGKESIYRLISEA